MLRGGDALRPDHTRASSGSGGGIPSPRNGAAVEQDHAIVGGAQVSAGVVRVQFRQHFDRGVGVGVVRVVVVEALLLLLLLLVTVLLLLLAEVLPVGTMSQVDFVRRELGDAV